MKLLFIGNSITKGDIGESFVKLFIAQHPDWAVKNAGINGDTLKNLSDRLRYAVALDSGYDFIIIEAGYNDIILPFFNKKGLLFQLALKHLLKKGRKPLHLIDFEKQYVKMIELILSQSNSKIIVTTLGCINENLASVLNVARASYNDLIIKIASNYNCLLADVSYEFEQVLHTKHQTDYLLNNFLNSVYFDLKASKKAGGADRLSRKRNLVLTIDGVHLNSMGAKIYKQTIEKQIKTAAHMVH